MASCAHNIVICTCREVSGASVSITIRRGAGSTGSSVPTRCDRRVVVGVVPRVSMPVTRLAGAVGPHGSGGRRMTSVAGA